MTPDALKAFEEHVLRKYPAEACGVLVGDAYIPCENVAVDPISDFAISAKEMAHIALTYGDITAILHSHPYNKAVAPKRPAEWPSHMDMHSWIQGTTPWGIVATDGEGITPVLWMDDANPEPLEGREFIWGVNDCYSLIRDWYRIERGITLKNYARGWGFWEQGVSLYDQHFADAGFVEIPDKDIQVGDVVLMRIYGPIESHGGVVTAPDSILHHLMHRQSGYDSLHKWRRCISRFIRYVGDKT